MRRNPPGSYFGDEEGFTDQTKGYSARVATFDCVLLVIAKKKVRQNAGYQSELVTDLHDAGELKKDILLAKKEDTRSFQVKVEEYKKENLNRINESKASIKKFVEFKSQGKLHGIKRDTLAEMVEKGMIDSSLTSKPFNQKLPSQKLKDLDELMHNGISRNIEEDQKSKMSQRKSLLLQAEDQKSFRSGNLVLDRQKKIIKQLRNLSEKYSEIGTNDLSRSFTKSQVDNLKPPEQAFGNLKKIIMQRQATNANKTAKVIKVKPILTRSPTLNLPEPLGPKNKSARDIDLEKEPSSLQILKGKHMELSMIPQVIRLKTTPRGLTTLAKVAGYKTSKPTEGSQISDYREF